jgi:hypothetical protein
MFKNTAAGIFGGFCAIMLTMDVSHAVETTGIPPEVVAEYIHAVIQADVAAEEWKAKGALPLPAQMLQMAGQEIQGLGLGLRIRLASLGPIYEKNGPADQFERTGLEAVAKNPRKPYTGISNENDRHIFKAIFADRAVSTACVGCHNSHELSTKRDYKLYDVMGGIIISFPIP